MEAIRRFVTVKDHKINITLPDDFNAEEVEVIILPSEKFTGTIPDWQIQQVQERSEAYLKNPGSAEDFDKAMKDIEDEL